MIYKLILTLRNRYYRGGRHSTKAERPTVCIGNISAGGTGKTPHTEMILRELLQSERWAGQPVAVLSRGYRRRSKGFRLLPIEASASLYGDEPAQIKHKFPAVAVAVDKDRVQGCAALAPDCGIILLDDAYQYRKLQADMNIVLSCYDRPVASDALLPFGRLRDLKSRLYDADVVIVSKSPGFLEDEEKRAAALALGYESYDPATATAVRKGRRQPILFTTLCYGGLEPVFPEGDPRYAYSRSIVLVSGIANDTPLRNFLSNSYKIAAHLRFPDHHFYTSGDVRKLLAAAKRNPTAAFVTTEKDAMRLRDLKNLPQKLRERLLFQPVSVEFLSPEEHDIFTAKLLTI